MWLTVIFSGCEYLLQFSTFIYSYFCPDSNQLVMRVNILLQILICVIFIFYSNVFIFPSIQSTWLKKAYSFSLYYMISILIWFIFSILVVCSISWKFNKWTRPAASNNQGCFQSSYFCFAINIIWLMMACGSTTFFFSAFQNLTVSRHWNDPQFTTLIHSLIMSENVPFHSWFITFIYSFPFYSFLMLFGDDQSVRETCS